MLLDKQIEVKLNKKTIGHFQNFGYTGNLGDIITVNVEHLPKGSHIVLRVLCDYCKEEIIYMEYREYLKSIKNIPKNACKKCKGLKIKESNLLKYNVENISQLTEVKEKKMKSCNEHYGVDYPLQSKEVLEKLRSTCVEKYGYPCSFQNKEVQETHKKTMIEKYGVPYTFLVEEIQDKKNKTILERYNVENVSQNELVKEKKKETTKLHFGVEWSLQSPEVREKITKTLYRNGTAPVSKQQLHIYTLYNTEENAELNFSLKFYNLDICFPDEKLCVEYDGGGHSLSCVIGNMSEKEFNRKEIIRDKTIKKEGYKIMRILSEQDFLPSDEILLDMLEHTRKYFSTYPEHSWITFNIDSSSIFNAENKEGVFFDYGTLRKIKKSDLLEESTSKESDTTNCA